MIVRHPAGRLATALVALLMVCGGATRSLGSAVQDSFGEVEVKAAFLYNFAKFVEWPADAFSAGRSRLALCVWSDDLLREVLEEIAAGKTANGREIDVRGVKEASEAQGCHVLFVGASATKQVPELLPQIARSPVLSVAALTGFASRGVIINFVMERNRLRFEINLGCAERARLKISSKLLALAQVVQTKDPAQEPP